MAIFALPAVATAAGTAGATTGFQLASMAAPVVAGAGKALGAFGLSQLLGGQSQQAQPSLALPQQAPQQLPTGLEARFNPTHRFRSLRFT